jgi:hypothetical protein
MEPDQPKTPQKIPKNNIPLGCSENPGTDAPEGTDTKEDGIMTKWRKSEKNIHFY